MRHCHLSSSWLDLEDLSQLTFFSLQQGSDSNSIPTISHLDLLWWSCTCTRCWKFHDLLADTAAHIMERLGHVHIRKLVQHWYGWTELIRAGLTYGANHLVLPDVQKLFEIKKKIPNLFPLGKMLLLMGQKDLQDGLNLDSKLREKFPGFTPGLHSTEGCI